MEVGLRPRSLGEFVGQRRVVDDLRVALHASRERGDPLDHVLFSGPPGLGKTSLARILASELGSRLHSTSGPAMERPKDLVGLLTQLEPGDVLFIDEVHRVPTAVEEYLYTAMEDYAVDITIDSGPHARLLTLTLKPFTLVGATTREGLLSAPFRARFGLFERLDPYPAADLVAILERSARLLGVELERAGAEVLAGRSRGTPRIANRFLRRSRDLAQWKGTRRVDAALATEALERVGVDRHGLEEMDRRFLRCLAQNAGGPVAIKTIAAVVGETEDTLEDVFEPHLLRHDFVQKTARGRLLTDAGWRVLGLEPGTRPEPPQEGPGPQGELFHP
ncbi:MAG: Holliday junction branch migration DNA helicase RuvB [Planctomycetota bacterium]